MVIEVDIDESEMMRFKLTKEQSIAFAQDIIDCYCNVEYFDGRCLEEMEKQE